MCQDDVSSKLDTTGGGRAIDRVFVEGGHKWEELRLMIGRKIAQRKRLFWEKCDALSGISLKCSCCVKCW